MGYCPYHVLNYASILAPLNFQTMKEQPSKVWWEEATYSSFKSILNHQPIRRLPDHSHPYILHTDVLDTGISAVLLQKWKGKLFPFSYASKLLSYKRRYSAMDKNFWLLFGLEGKSTILGSSYWQITHYWLTYEKTKYGYARIVYQQNFWIKV